MQVPLAIFLLAIFSLPARADFRVCNKTHALINIAVGTDAGEAFKTEGWWVATPGSCATPIRGPLKSRFVYLYATDIDGVDLVTGTATMCIDRGKFVAYGADNCWRRGLQAVTFAEIDTLDFVRLDDLPDRSAEVKSYLTDESVGRLDRRDPGEPQLLGYRSCSVWNARSERPRLEANTLDVLDPELLKGPPDLGR